MEQSTNRKFYYVIVALLLIMILLGKWACNNRDQYKEAQAMNTTMADTLHHYKDRDGRNHAKIQQFQTDKANDFLAFQSQDNMIKKLQEEVKKNKGRLGKGGSVTIADTFTEASGTVATEVIPTKEPEFPIYKSKIDLKGWVVGESIATKDSTTYKIQTRDTITLILGEEKTGFLGLGKRKPFADITNESPYSTTKNMRSYQVTPAKRSKIKIGLGTTYGLTFTQWGVGMGTTVGATISYSPF